MLPLPQLDNRSFEQLVREARHLIPSITSEWTDENAHDPGITLLELLAWHIEMQQYQLDRITDNHERKFLRLLGELPRDVTPSTTSVSISKSTYPMYIPYGTLLRVRDLPFETTRPVTVLPESGQTVELRSSEGLVSVKDDVALGRLTLYPFGSEGELQASMTIIREKPLPPLLPLSLWIELDRQDPEIRIPARYTQYNSSAAIQWYYRDEHNYENEEESGWQPLLLERDETYHFHQSGPILFSIPKGARTVRQIRAVLEAGSYHDAPRIKRLVWNEVFAVQGRTFCMSQCFDGREPGSNQQPEILFKHGLFLQSGLIVQLQMEEGWEDVPASMYMVNYTDELASLQFTSGIRLPYGKQSIRVVAYAAEFEKHLYLATGTGVSGQRYPLPVQPLLADTLHIQTGRLDKSSGRMLWQDWQRVHDFDESSATCRHFVIDTEEGSVYFSDGIHGAVPPACSEPNIRFIYYRTGTGAAGNVKADTIHELDYFNIPLHVTNLYPAYGGREGETLKEALLRAKQAVLQPNCGVTEHDIERRVREIPGLRLARVKAIGGYNPARIQGEAGADFGHISVVVVPYSSRELPYPSEGMIRTIRAHLEPYRLLTTVMHIIPPVYVKVTVRAVLVVHPQYEGREHELTELLRSWLQPYSKDGSGGWEFGRPVYKSDVFDLLHRSAGVQYVQDVWLSVDGTQAFVDAGGDIRIPPNGLAISGEHDIEFIAANS